MSNPKRVPFLDLVTPHRELENELVEVYRKALHTAGFIGGPMVEGFERDFAAFCETKHCVGVGSGTDALRFALMALGVTGGETVLTVPNTFIATTEAITQAGAKIDFVDIDPKTYNLDPAKLKDYLEKQCTADPKSGKRVSKRTGTPVAAVIPVHLYGQMADMDGILELARGYGLSVVEDACQAQGAEYYSKKENRWRKAGSVGAAAAFSFYPGKNLGACGEAGAVTTNDEKLAAAIRMIRDHGQAQKYYHDIEGYNGRLDAIQAGILQVKLKHLAGWNSRRQEAAARYTAMLADVDGIITPFEPDWSRSVYHLYVIRLKDREALRKHLAGLGIDTGLHYPLPLHQQKAYAHLGYRTGEFPVAESAASEILSLPMFPSLTGDQQHMVQEGIRSFNSSTKEMAGSTAR